MSINIKNLIDTISARVVTFLDEEMNIKVDTNEIKLVHDNRLALKHLTSLVTLGSSPHIFVIFSYEEAFINKLFEIYTKELDILPEERLEYLEETAGDIVNIIVGNITSEFDNNGKVINLSPPIVLSQAQSITKSRTVKFFVNNLCTSYGIMSIFCVGPNELFEI